MMAVSRLGFARRSGWSAVSRSVPFRFKASVARTDELVALFLFLASSSCNKRMRSFKSTAGVESDDETSTK
jgi:hypothetical protein